MIYLDGLHVEEIVWSSFVGAEYQQLALPREGHLDAAVHAMTYVGQKYDSRLVYGPSYPDIDHYIFKKCDWSECYWYPKEVIPVNAPEPKGVDGDHAGDRLF